MVAVLVVIIILAISALTSNQPSNNPADKKVVTFGFDNEDPLLIETQGTPLNQTSNGVTAYFSSPSDTQAASTFSIRSLSSTFLQLSSFSGKYLYDNNNSSDILEIKLSIDVRELNITFATVEEGELLNETSKIVAASYKNTNLVDTTAISGTFNTGTYPQGVLYVNPGKAFNLVRVSIPTQTSGTTDFLVDNIVVTYS